MRVTFEMVARARRCAFSQIQSGQKCYAREGKKMMQFSSFRDFSRRQFKVKIKAIENDRECSGQTKFFTHTFATVHLN